MKRVSYKAALNYTLKEYCQTLHFIAENFKVLQ